MKRYRGFRLPERREGKKGRERGKEREGGERRGEEKNGAWSVQGLSVCVIIIGAIMPPTTLTVSWRGVRADGSEFFIQANVH